MFPKWNMLVTMVIHPTLMMNGGLLAAFTSTLLHDTTGIPSVCYNVMPKSAMSYTRSKFGTMSVPSFHHQRQFLLKICLWHRAVNYIHAHSNNNITR